MKSAFYNYDWKARKKALVSFLTPFDVLDFDFEAAIVYGELRATLEKKSIPIGPQDLFIAAHAL